MPTRGHGRPALQIAHARRPLAWRTDDLVWECSHGCRDADALTSLQTPWMMAHLIVEPKRTIDRLCHPVQHDIGEQGIFTDTTLEVTVRVRPTIKFFRDPGCQPCRRVVQGIRQRLWFGALDPLVTR